MLRTWHIQGLPADAEVSSVEVEYKLDVIPVDSRHAPGVTIMITGTATIYMEHFREVVNETHHAGRDIVNEIYKESKEVVDLYGCLLYTSPSPRDRQKSRMPSSA